MNLIKMVENCAKKMKWQDMSLLKLCVFFTTLFLITAWTGFRNLVLSFDWYWYLASNNLNDTIAQEDVFKIIFLFYL